MAYLAITLGAIIGAFVLGIFAGEDVTKEEIIKQTWFVYKGKLYLCRTERANIDKENDK